MFSFDDVAQAQRMYSIYILYPSILFIMSLNSVSFELGFYTLNDILRFLNLSTKKNKKQLLFILTNAEIAYCLVEGIFTHWLDLTRLNK